MNRIDRLSAILMQLQSRKTVRAQDIAMRFQISLRTVYRDVRALEEAGVPVIGEAGHGYSLVEGYRLPPVMFTRAEATAFITAEKLVGQFTDQANAALYTMAMDKIRSVLKTADKDYVALLDDKIQVLRAKPAVAGQAQHNPLQLILEAVAGNTVLRLHYFAYYRQEQTERDIEPVGVFYLDHHWHLIAWCRWRLAYRDFRFDRIGTIQGSGEQFIQRHPSLKRILDEQYRELKLEEVKIRVDTDAALHLGEQKYYQGYVSEVQEEEGTEMLFLTSSVEGFSRWFMTFADCAVVLASEPVKDRVRTLFDDIQNKMKKF